MSLIKLILMKIKRQPKLFLVSAYNQLIFAVSMVNVNQKEVKLMPLLSYIININIP